MMHPWSYRWLIACLTLATIIGFYEMTIAVIR